MGRRVCIIAAVRDRVEVLAPLFDRLRSQTLSDEAGGQPATAKNFYRLTRELLHQGSVPAEDGRRRRPPAGRP
jgi:hypothetical protein